ncbi:MAG: hypothetical protein IPL72_03335 [Sulfuritalea sp.]|nr:hypothetical protein [Sulfuritalea sp.]
MNLPDIARDYDARGSAAAFSVLIELGQVLGAYRQKFVIVGGAVPWLLMPNVRPSHIGTLDVDLNLSPEALSAGEYASLIESLETAGYERGLDDLKPFQLRRWVRLDAGEPIAILIDLMMPDDAKTRKNRPPLVDGLRVIEASGGRVALDHNVVRHIEGRMPDGRNNSVDLLVASIPAFLVMKGYALIGRDKKKDAYDIYFSVRNFDGGPIALAEACKELLADESVTTGYRNIAGKFQHEDDFGPQTVKAFLAESDALGEMTAEQIQVDAFMQVRAWLRALGLTRDRA